MGRFLLNIGYRWSGAPEDVDGFVLCPSAMNSVQLAGRELEHVDQQWVLFDPQLYLAGLDGEACTKTCAKLATYPWFGIQVPPYDGTTTVRDWFMTISNQVTWAPVIADDDTGVLEAVRTCIQYQRDLGVTHLLAPAPLVSNSEDQFGTQLRWLVAAESLRNEFEAPMFASVAIMDHLLRDTPPEENTLLQTILDNITARQFEGIYVVVVCETAEVVRLLDRNVAESLLYISHMVGRRCEMQAIINHADDWGYACLAAGATGFASGSSYKQRRMCLADFIKRDGGKTYPRFYSHSLISDFLTQDDLSKLRDARLLRLLRDDQTTEAEPLLAALAQGLDANVLPAWRQRYNNIQASAPHRIKRLVRAARELSALPADQQLETTMAWLQEAQAHMSLINDYFENDPLSELGRHVPVWSRAFANVLRQIEQ